MSGTSLDGVDAIILRIRGTDPASIEWNVLGFHSEPYGPQRRDRIREAIESGGARELALIHLQLAEDFARVFKTLAARTGVDPSSMTAVGSHGQTVWHEPPSDGRRGVTLQLGDAAALAESLQCPVIADFRSRDMAASGHGAPLVPWSDWVLLRRPGIGRALQNLGGMGNVTFLPADGDAGAVRGFDTGPGMALVDRATQLATDGREPWDVEGRRAARGTVIPRLLEKLLSDAFFSEAPPRSTGRERFGDRLVHEIVTELKPLTEGEWDDLLATLTELTARSVAGAYDRFLPAGEVNEVVLTGGGAQNPTMVAALERALAPLPVRTGAEALGIDPDAKEAAAFAVLAWANVNGIPGNVPAVTGARGRRVLGAAYPRGEASARG